MRVSVSIVVAVVTLTLRASAQSLPAAHSGAVLPTASAFPARYDGNCPAPIEWVGHVTVTVAGTRVDYQWERSDGSRGKVLHAQIGKPATTSGQNDTIKPPTITEAVISDKWRPGRPSQGGRFWEKLHILSPFDIMSSAAQVDVACRT